MSNKQDTLTEQAIVDRDRMKQQMLQRFLAPAALVIIYIYFGIFGRNFFSYPVLVNIIDSSYYIGFIAIGVTFVIIAGGIDLSVGTVMMCAATVGGTALTQYGWSMEASLLLIMVVGTAFGFFNGFVIAYFNMPPFIVTLGTMMISMGTGSIVANVRSSAFPSRSAEGGWFKQLFKYISEERQIIPTGAFILLAVVIIGHIILTRTRFGRYVYAMGSNREAARLSGIDVRKWTMLTYVVAGVCAGIGGIAFAATYTTVIPAQGQGFELFAIAAAVIGGTSLSGGVGSVFGTLIGVFIMAVLSNGLPSMGLQAHYQTFFTGVVVIGAVGLDQYRTRKASEAKVVTEADSVRQDGAKEIQELRRDLAEAKEQGDKDRVAELKRKIGEKRREVARTYRAMKRKEKENRQKLAAEERAAEQEFEKILKEDQSRDDRSDQHSTGVSGEQ